MMRGQEEKKKQTPLSSFVVPTGIARLEPPILRFPLVELAVER